MVIGIAFISGLIQTICMPGCVMHHGRSRAVDKVLVFLHAFALMFGFDVGLLQCGGGSENHERCDRYGGGS